MSLQHDIQTLNRMRFLGEDDDIDVFDQIVYDISLKGENSNIVELCTVFEDSVVTPAALDNLVEAIFSIANRCGLDEGMYQIVKGISKMLPHGKSWALKINRMILNYEPFNIPYINGVKRLDSEEMSVIVDLLFEIKNKDSNRFSSKVDNVVNSI